jgi:hypothetical protein
LKPIITLVRVSWSETLPCSLEHIAAHRQINRPAEGGG